MKITFTGIDRRTTKTDIRGLLKDHRVEIGILVSSHPDGRNRYMEPEEILRALEWCDGRAALHLCGNIPRMSALAGDLDAMIAMAGRIQVNGALPTHLVADFCRVFPKHEVITQHTDRNYRLLSVGANNHAVLVDGSGGRGISPSEWVRPMTGKSVGFAGGLGPDNITTEIARIREMAREPFWIDMEGKIRNGDDWFDEWACYKVLEQLEGLE